MERKISVAIPHYNNSKFMTDTLTPLLFDKRIDQIIVCDDNSKDKEKESLTVLIDSLKSDKIIVYYNEENIGSYLNKLLSLSKCSNEWAILLDSDNIINTDYIDKLYEIKEWHNTKIYAPDTPVTFPGKPSVNMNYTKYSNTAISKRTYLDHFGISNFQCLINTCNYFVPVKEYCNCMNKTKDTYKRSEIDCLDSAVLFTDWMLYGNKIFVVKDLTYKHRLHNNSNYSRGLSRKHEGQIRHIIFKKMESYKES